MHHHHHHHELFEALNAKKYEILGELELAKQALLRDLACVDRVTRAKLRFIVDNYDKFEANTATRISRIEANVNELIKNHVIDPAEVRAAIAEMEELLTEVQNNHTELISSVNAITSAFNDKLSGKKVVILGDSNAVRYQNSNLLENSAKNVSVQKLAVGASTLKGGDNSIQDQVSRIQGTPDYIIVWGGGNDINQWSDKKIGVPTYNSINPDDFDSTTTFGGLNKILYTLKTSYPTAKVIGVIRTCRHSWDRTKFNFTFSIINKLYRKWGVPVVNMEYVANMSSTLDQILSTYYEEDKSHYGPLALEITNNLIVDAIQNGGNVFTDIPCNTYYYDAPMNVKDNVFAAAEALLDGYGGTARFENCIFRSIDNSTYSIVNAFIFSGRINILRFSANEPEIVHWHKDNNGNVTERNFSVVVKLESGDITTLKTGDYTILHGNIGNCTNLPSNVSTGSGGFTLAVRTLSSSVTIYTLIAGNGKMWIGRKAGTTLNWYEK